MSVSHLPQQVPQELAEKFRDNQWGAEQLSKISIFRNFTQEELVDLYSSGEIRSYRPKAHAVIEGEPTRGLYIILAGTVSVYKTNDVTGTLHRLALLEEGANFGELSLFDTAPRTATVSAESTCHMFFLDADVFERFLEHGGPHSASRFYKACAEELVGRFRNLNSDYVTAQQLIWKYALRKPEDENNAQATTENQSDP